MVTVVFPLAPTSITNSVPRMFRLAVGVSMSASASVRLKKYATPLPKSILLRPCAWPVGGGWRRRLVNSLSRRTPPVLNSIAARLSSPVRTCSCHFRRSPGGGLDPSGLRGRTVHLVFHDHDLTAIRCGSLGQGGGM